MFVWKVVIKLTSSLVIHMCLVNYSNGLIEHLRRYHPEVLTPNLSQINSIVDGNANIMIMLIAGAIIAFICHCIITFL